MQMAKDDTGKVRPSLAPVQIIKDVAIVRKYGIKKYHDPDNWKKVELQRYIDAFYRHWLSFIENNLSVDSESGIEHYKHAACNMAFICELMREKGQATDCSHRQYFGDYSLHYCDIDNAICDTPTQCTKKEDKDESISNSSDT